MSFWNKSSGEAATATMDQEGAESGKLAQIPDNSYLSAVVTDVELARVPDDEFEQDVYEYEGYRVSWCITEPGEFQGVTVRQKLRVMSKHTRKRDQALDVLAFMDLHMNGGRFRQMEEAPDSQDLADAFGSTEMIVKINAMVSIDQQSGRENYNQWVSGCYRNKPQSHEAHATPEAALSSAMGKLSAQKQASPAPANGPKAGPAVQKPANGPAPVQKAGPAGPKLTQQQSTASGETAEQKRLRLAREQQELAELEAAEEERKRLAAEESAAIAAEMAQQELEGEQQQDMQQQDQGDLGY